MKNDCWFQPNVKILGRLLLYTYLHPPIRGFFLQSFCFHIGGEHPKRDVALNGNQSLGLIQENKSFYSWMTVSQPGIEIVANCSFLDELFFKNQESYDRIFCLFYFYFCNSVKFCTKKMLPTIGSCWKFVGTHGQLITTIHDEGDWSGILFATLIWSLQLHHLLCNSY